MRPGGMPNVPQLEEKRDVRGLVRALRYRDPCDAMWGNAVQALGRLGDPGSIQSILGSLEEQGFHKNEPREGLAPWRAEALVIEAILGFGSSALPSLTQALRDRNRRTRLTAVEALGLTRDPRAVGPLCAALGDESSLVRERAAEALGQIGDPAALEALVRALRDADHGVRGKAVRALALLGDARAAGPLGELLHDDDWRMRRAVEDALKALTPERP
jgi:HEAT repeat protein